MDFIDVDILATRLVEKNIVTNRNMRQYGKVFFSSTDRLSSILPLFDFKDKDILTVIGSGEQAFRFYMNGATYLDY